MHLFTAKSCRGIYLSDDGRAHVVSYQGLTFDTIAQLDVPLLHVDTANVLVLPDVFFQQVLNANLHDRPRVLRAAKSVLQHFAV